MAMLTVRNIDEQLKTHLRIRAAEDGCSMEEEVRRILRKALAPAPSATHPGSGLGSRLHQQIKALAGGVDIELPERSMPRPAPEFDRDTQ
jgi:plasmid stability protein